MIAHSESMAVQRWRRRIGNTTSASITTGVCRGSHPDLGFPLQKKERVQASFYVNRFTQRSQLNILPAVCRLDASNSWEKRACLESRRRLPIKKPLFFGT
jgi:ABC-type antimicrobial peptide transport system ATPase subunit